MKHFQYETPSTFEEAGKIVAEAQPGETAVMAGGSDLLGVLKTELLETYPSKVVSLHDVKGADYIRSETDSVKVGSLTTLNELETSDALAA